MKTRIVFLLVVMLITPFIVSCTYLLIRSTEKEYRGILNKNSTQQDVRRLFGKPVKSNVFEKSTSATDAGVFTCRDEDLMIRGYDIFKIKGGVATSESYAADWLILLDVITLGTIEIFAFPVTVYEVGKDAVTDKRVVILYNDDMKVVSGTIVDDKTGRPIVEFVHGRYPPPRQYLDVEATFFAGHSAPPPDFLPVCFVTNLAHVNMLFPLRLSSNAIPDIMHTCTVELLCGQRIDTSFMKRGTTFDIFKLEHTDIVEASGKIKLLSNVYTNVPQLSSEADTQF